MAITADMVKQLREETGAGMLDCKKALEQYQGNLEQAKAYLAVVWSTLSPRALATELRLVASACARLRELPSGTGTKHCEHAGVAV